MAIKDEGKKMKTDLDETELRQAQGRSLTVVQRRNRQEHPADEDSLFEPAQHSFLRAGFGRRR